MIKLSPSILSIDFMEIGKEIRLLEREGIPYIHIDVMDGMFVPNITVGMPVIESIRKFTDLTLDVHLMINKPERYIESFAECGADIINVHYEALENPTETLKKIRSVNKKSAVTIKPCTPPESIFNIIEYADMVLVMSVEPGFGGQKFLDGSLSKINKIADFASRNNFNIDIEMDGGINLDNVRNVIDAGANVIVVGSAIFSKQNQAEEIKKYYDIFSSYEG